MASDASEPPIPEVILDTNVILSGIFFGGTPGRILEAWHDGRLTLVLSPPILAEYHRAGAALAARYPDVAAPLYSILALLAQSARMVDAPHEPQALSPDPDDDKFLMCAASADTRLIVSGDKALRSVSGWAGIEILTPRQFLERYLRGSGTQDP